MVLVDTSVWVSYLRGGNSRLAALLQEAEVACHPFVIGELACGKMKNRGEILTLLGILPATPVITQDEFLHFIHANKLDGKGLGFVDIHLLAAARLARMPIWTDDRNLKVAARQLRLAYD